jgi:hypothetical protein
MYQCSGSGSIGPVGMFLGLPDPHPDPLVRGPAPRIRIRTKMSQIRNIASTKASSVHIALTNYDEKKLTQVEKWWTAYILPGESRGLTGDDCAFVRAFLLLGKHLCNISYQTPL